MTVERYYSVVEKKLKSGLFSITVLKVIAASTSPVHGYVITQYLKNKTNGVLYIKAGTLYPILRSLENQGLIRHTSIKSKRGPPKKTYEVTDEGKEALEKVQDLLDQMIEAVDKIRCKDSMDPNSKGTTNSVDLNR